MRIEVIHHFDGRDGEMPFGALMQADDGYLYGTTKFGGARKKGVIFRVKLDGSDYQVVHAFGGGSEDGAYPCASLVQGTDGALYGATGGGGCLRPKGVIFRVQPDGSDFQVLHKFTARRYDGQLPYAGVILAADGAFYGTTPFGGAHGHGVVYRVNADGSNFKVLYSFKVDAYDGAFPSAGVIQGKDGALYGTTPEGGVYRRGIVFKLNTDGSDFQILQSFGGGERGINQYAGLTQGADGVLYGAATSRGAHNKGFVFRLNPDGTDFEVLHCFTGGKDGAHPWAPVLLAPDGAMYGTTAAGDYDDRGVIYRMKPDGSDYEILYGFSGGPDGSAPCSGLIQASDGALYGTATGGGSKWHGVIFKIELG